MLRLRDPRSFGLLLLSFTWLGACGAPAAPGSPPPEPAPVPAAESVPIRSPAPAANATSPLGTNLAGVTYYSTQLPFVDVFKTSSGWIPSNDTTWDTGEKGQLITDEDGWVKTIPASGVNYTKLNTLMLRGMPGSFRGGRYVVLYRGSGTLTYGFAASRIAAESRPGRDVIDVDSSNASGVLLTVTSTDPNHTGDYVRDIRVVPIEYEHTYQTQVFNPDFLAVVRNFSVLRFMDWMRTNESVQQDWADRPRPSTSTYGGRDGVPLEVMAQLSNTLRADPWFNMPHKATDDYVRRFAVLARSLLEPERQVYVEYSNEVWNGAFGQSAWVDQQASAQWPESTGASRRHSWFGQRTAQVCGIWKTIFADNPGRVTCVMGSQAANPWVSAQALDCPLSEMKPCSAHGITALAIAPYVGGYLGSPGSATQVQSWTTDQLFQELTQGGVLSGSTVSALQQSANWMSQQAAVAAQRKLHLIAYEGGQHLVGYRGAENNAAMQQLFHAANRDPRMGDVYARHLQDWRAAGGRLFMNFTDVGRYSKWGSWGALEDLAARSSPKYDALQRFITSNPRWW